MIVRDLWILTKPGITAFVVLTAAAGFVAASGAVVPWSVLVATLAGTALVAAGTNGLNQWWERDADGLMRRTRDRPLPAGRVSPNVALAFCSGLAVVGIAALARFAGGVPAALAGITLASYILVYTPLKRRTPAATLIGAVPGALPILGGWAASGRSPLEPVAVALFGVLFLWQIPHFLALAWLYRDDYARAGFVTLLHADPSGGAPARQGVLYAAVLVPLSLVPAVHGPSSPVFALAAVALGGWLVARAVRFARSPCATAARRLFLATIAYLPLVLCALVADRLIG